MKAHNLKLDDKYFDDVKFGYKNFEIRKNDRDYQVGDVLFLHRFNDGNFLKMNKSRYGLNDGLVSTEEYEADTIMRKIIYIEPDYQIDGYVTLGLEPFEGEYHA